MKIVIIGSGMAGLTAAAYLVKAGHAVTVYEQYPTPGGVTATVEQDGYHWDIGPLLLEGFAPGDKGRVILEELGISDHVPAIHEDRGLSMPEFTLWPPQEYEGPYWRREKLKELFPEEADALDHYYEFYDQMMKLMSLARKSEAARGPAVFTQKLRMLLAFQPVKHMVNWNGSQVMDFYFKSPVLKTLFLGIVADFVTAPSEFPGLGVPSLHLETAFDKRIPTYPGTRSAQTAYVYVLNGCQTMVDAMLDVIQHHGGRVFTGMPVKRIVIENGGAAGVQFEGGRIEPADRVLASGGTRNSRHVSLIHKKKKRIAELWFYLPQWPSRMPRPTMTPSASAPTCLACSGVPIPNPTHTGTDVCSRTRAIKSPSPSEMDVRAPVTPVTETR